MTRGWCDVMQTASGYGFAFIKIFSSKNVNTDRPIHYLSL